jgi:hypothetical protein
MLTNRRKLLWDPPRARIKAATTIEDGDKEEEEEEKKVSWLELFYDLVFVAATAKLAHLVVHTGTLGMSAHDLSLITCKNSTTGGHGGSVTQLGNASANGTAAGRAAYDGWAPPVFGMSEYWELVLSFFLYALSLWRICKVIQAYIRTLVAYSRSTAHTYLYAFVGAGLLISAYRFFLIPTTISLLST